MSFDFYTILGYVASIIVAVSLMMSSIIKLRIINLIGAAFFSLYGFLIEAYPVGFLNGFIALVDLYYIILFINKKDFFELLQIQKNDPYLTRFLDYYQQDIQKFFPNFSYNADLVDHCFLILRNMSVAGVFMAQKKENHTLYVALDYVIPAYRDFKNGDYIYNKLVDSFKSMGYQKIISLPWSKSHKKYLRKLGFQKSNDIFLEKNISS